jgi:tRNA A37 threonylcarbamoyladenosine dehydratase
MQPPGKEQLMEYEFSRTERLLGKEAIERLRTSSVAVFGIGGVGSHAAEGLARSGIGTIGLFDHDTVCLSNINRQLIATHRTLGRKKVDVMKERIADINPSCTVLAFDCFYTAGNADDFDLSRYDYIVDAIDTISSKLVLIERAKKAGVPIISCMSAGNKLNPAAFDVADIRDTSVCPIARVLRKELKARGIRSLKVVYSREVSLKPSGGEPADGRDAGASPPFIGGKDSSRRQIPGSVSFVPPVAGFILASEVVKDLIKAIPAADTPSEIG